MDTNEQIRQLQERITKLEALFATLGNAASISPDIQRALLLTMVSTTTKAASSEDRAVNESGTSSYSVLKSPDRFIRIGMHNVPAFD